MRSNQSRVADFEYVATWRSFVYVAFVIAVFSRRIVGWRASVSMRSGLPPDALEQAIHDRETGGGSVCHTDRGAQYPSIRYPEPLAEAGIAASVGSRGDRYDDALAESVIGSFDTEVIRRGWSVPRARVRGVRDARMGRVVQHVSAARAARLPAPAEYEAQYHWRSVPPQRRSEHSDEACLLRIRGGSCRAKT